VTGWNVFDVRDACTSLPYWVRWVEAVGPTVATAAAVGVALYVHVTGSRAQRQLAAESEKTRRMAVRPVVVREIRFLREPAFAMTLELVNVGLGPAEIVGRQEFIDDKPLAPDPPTYWSQVKMALDPENRFRLGGVGPGVDISVGSDGRVMILRLESALYAMAPRVRTEFSYESIYGDSFPGPTPGGIVGPSTGVEH
jgi:hypothetical protein